MTMPAAIANRNQIAQAIINRIASGEFLVDICRDKGMPSRQTFWEWVDADASLATQCARARARSAADDEREVALLARRVVAGDLAPEAARVAINARTWLAKVRNPKVYGDRLDVEHSGKVQVIPVLNVTLGPPGPITIDVTPGTPDGEQQ